MKNKLTSRLLASAITAAALVGGASGVSHAADGTSCSDWKKIISSGIWARTCIQWSGTSSDRAYVEIENDTGSSRKVRATATLATPDSDMLTRKIESKWIANGATYKLYTNWVGDYTWGAEKALGGIRIYDSLGYFEGSHIVIGWAYEPAF
ncbi:hypothetical protein [Streptomyces sp. NPDC056480]|uniref:hypothetical protein n=1 Tax=Streptomyces sp. NPDC056480 TaxID=3345833 RepID=UPI0036C5E209